MKTFIIFIVLTACAFCAAGQAIIYQYDNSGNRIKRMVKSGDNTENIAGDEKLLAQTKAASTSTTEITLDADTATVKPAETFAPQAEPFRVMVYPNPTSGIFELELPDLQENQKAYLEIHTLAGTLVRRIDGLQNMQSVDISNQAAGLYPVRIMVDKKSVTKIMIKE